MAPPIDSARLATVHSKIRAAREALAQEFKTADDALKADLRVVEVAMLKHLQDSGSESIRTKAGTFYRQVETLPRVDDWDALYEWIKANNTFDALERRFKKTYLTSFMEDNEGRVPPGVSVLQEYVVRVRRA